MTRRSGFTLVELNLAMAFVAILLLGVAMTTIYVTRIYQKGLTVRTINQIGREVNGQIRNDIMAASPSQIVFEPGSGTGRLCLGPVSYIYNTAATIASSGDVIRDADGEPVYLTRVVDETKSWCEHDVTPGSGYTKSQLAVGEQATELLANDVIPLAMHDFALSIFNPDSSVSDIHQTLFAVSMQLGTNEAETTDGSGKCLPPNASTANFDNCFIAEFETVIRAGEVTRK